MSHQDADRFFEILRADRQLQDVLTREHARGRAGERAVAMAAEHGLRITAEEFDRKLREVAPAAAAGSSGELSDEDLETVAGGKWGGSPTPTTSGGPTIKGESDDAEHRQT